MSLEIEAKIKVDDHDTIRQKLTELGGRRIGRVRETNRILDDEDHTLRRAGKGLRVRHIEVLDGPPVPCSISYKGPVQRAELKVRPEHEVQVSDPHSALRIFEFLGYKPLITFEKIRETWRLGPCSVELDELPVIGLFVEIEGPDQRSVCDIKASLGLASAPHIARGYISLLLAVSSAAGQTATEIRF